MRRTPPKHASADDLARECGITTVSFNNPLPEGLNCHYCGGIATSRDHIVPDSAGGSRDWWNLVPSCVPCNVEKADRQSCACLFCLRAMALWHLGYRRTGKSYRDLREAKRARRSGAAHG